MNEVKEELFSHRATDRWANEHFIRLCEVGRELELYYQNRGFNHKTNNVMTFTHKTIDEQQARIRADKSLDKKTMERRIGTWEELRPTDPADDSIEADIKAWGADEVKASGKISDNSLKTINPSADIKEWANTHNQTKQ